MIIYFQAFIMYLNVQNHNFNHLSFKQQTIINVNNYYFDKLKKKFNYCTVCLIAVITRKLSPKIRINLLKNVYHPNNIDNNRVV